MKSKFIDFKQLNSKKGISYTRDHLRRKVRAREFPQPVVISPRRIAWVEDEIDEWIAAKIANRGEEYRP